MVDVLNIYMYIYNMWVHIFNYSGIIVGGVGVDDHLLDEALGED